MIGYRLFAAIAASSGNQTEIKKNACIALRIFILGVATAIVALLCLDINMFRQAMSIMMAASSTLRQMMLV